MAKPTHTVQFWEELSPQEQKIALSLLPFRRVCNFHPQTLANYFACIQADPELKPNFPIATITEISSFKQKLLHLGLLRLAAPEESEYIYALHPMMMKELGTRSIDFPLTSNLYKAYYLHYEYASESFSEVLLEDDDLDLPGTIAFIQLEEENFANGLFIGAGIGESFIFSLLVLVIAEIHQAPKNKSIFLYEEMMEIDLVGTGRHLEWLTISYLRALFYYAKENYVIAADIMEEVLRQLHLHPEWAEGVTMHGTFLHLLGRIYNEAGNLDKAEYCFKKSIDIYTERNDLFGKADILVSLAYLLLKFEHSEAAEATLNVSHMEIMKLNQATEQPSIEAGFLLQKGSAAYQLEKYDAAIEAYEAGRKLFAAKGNIPGVIATLQGLGIAHSALKEFRTSVSYYKMAIEASLESTGHGNIEMGKLLINLGNDLMQLKEYQESLDYYNRAIDRLGQPENRLLKAKVMQSIANAYFFLGQLDESVNTDSAVLEIFLELEDLRGILEVLHNAETVQMEHPGLKAFDQFLGRVQEGVSAEMFAEISVLFGQS